MKISVLMPTFRRKAYLRDAVIALKSQTHEDWELLIKEGGEGEGHSVISDLIQDDNRIIYIHSKDKGITDAVNYAMRVATGDLFIWANDDDLLLPNAMELIVNNLSGYPWGHGKIKMTRDGEMVSEMGYQVTIEDLIDGNKIPQPAVFWTREAYRHVGPMSCEQDLVSDYDYWLKLIKQYPDYKFINEYLAEYRLHDDQLTKKARTEQLRQANIIKQGI